ncbi:MAG: ribosome-binding factor A [bacterium]|nr:ribosome-binding factor A [bacterium]
MTNSQKQQQVSEQVAHLAAEFLGKESNRQSLITVTRADISPDMKRATVYMSVLPDDQQEQALDFAKRRRRDCRDFMKKHTKLRVLPFLDFAIDYGEKHRQNLDDISRGL